MNKPTIYPLFSTPVYVNNVGESALPDVMALQYETGPHGFLTSADKSVLDRPDFAQLRALVVREVNVYARELLKVKSTIELYVTSSWISIHRRGDTAVPHIHHNSLISGVLYLKVNERSGDLVFQRDLLSLVPFPPAIDLDMDSFNIYNCKTWGVKPKPNDLCLFPSVLTHSVDPNESDEECWCLVFDVFARGTFGTHHRLTVG